MTEAAVGGGNLYTHMHSTDAVPNEITSSRLVKLEYTETRDHITAFSPADKNDPFACPLHDFSLCKPARIREKMFVYRLP